MWLTRLLRTHANPRTHSTLHLQGINIYQLGLRALLLGGYCPCSKSMRTLNSFIPTLPTPSQGRCGVIHGLLKCGALAVCTSSVHSCAWGDMVPAVGQPASTSPGGLGTRLGLYTRSLSTVTGRRD